MISFRLTRRLVNTVNAKKINSYQPTVRLDQALVLRGLATTRSQASNLIKLKQVLVNNRVVEKSAWLAKDQDKITLAEDSQVLVSRAGLKLASVAQALALDFSQKRVLDVGSSTGGFTDFALRQGAKEVLAVDVGTDQLHPSLRRHPKVKVYEKTDIRDFHLTEKPDLILIDVSFISLRQILPHIAEQLADEQTQIVAMLKPQFEVGREAINKGVVKNEKLRRLILQAFEQWAKDLFVIQAKRDSEVTGAKGNRERFYLLTLKRNSTTSSGCMT